MRDLRAIQGYSRRSRGRNQGPESDTGPAQRKYACLTPALPDDVVDREADVGQGFGSQNLSTLELTHARVSVRGGLAMRFDGLSREVDKPGFPDASPRIYRHLPRAVLLHGALGDLNDEKEVGRPWMALGIARQGRTEEGQVRLGLGVRSQRNGALRSHDRSICKSALQRLTQSIHTHRVARANGDHFDDLSLDELDAVILLQDPRVDHPPVLVDRESPGADPH